MHDLKVSAAMNSAMKSRHEDSVKLLPRLESKGLGKENALVTAVADELVVDDATVVEVEEAAAVKVVNVVYLTVVVSGSFLRRRSS